VVRSLPAMVRRVPQRRDNARSTELKEDADSPLRPKPCALPRRGQPLASCAAPSSQGPPAIAIGCSCGEEGIRPVSLTQGERYVANC
jgi:hypothetical protein